MVESVVLFPMARSEDEVGESPVCEDVGDGVVDGWGEGGGEESDEGCHFIFIFFEEKGKKNLQFVNGNGNDNMFCSWMVMGNLRYDLDGEVGLNVRF